MYLLVILTILGALSYYIYNKKYTSKKKITVCFSPRGCGEKLLISKINKAKKYIYVAIFSFTNSKIARALINARKRGVKVYVIVDEGQLHNKHIRNLIRKLIRNGIIVKAKRGTGGGLMHHKYAVIDGKIVLTGSYNWTYSAENRNDENLICLENYQTVAKKYLNNFSSLWKQKYKLCNNQKLVLSKS